MGKMKKFQLFVLCQIGWGFLSPTQAAEGPLSASPVIVAVSSDTEKPAGLAEQVLQTLAEDQQTLLFKIEQDPNSYSETEKELKLAEINKRYDTFVTENPKNIYGLILYGKFLRMISATAKAKAIFLKAKAIDDSLPVIHQQLSNCFAEEGNHASALDELLRAIQLSPSVAQYHYQLGELLVTYHKEFLKEKVIESAVLEKKMQEAFAEAAKLAPQERSFALRYAESFYELEKPDWSAAMKCWEDLRKTSKSPKEEDLIAFNQASILFEMKKFEEARAKLGKVFHPDYEAARQELLGKLPKPPTSNK